MSDRVVEEIRDRADLVEICGEYMSLKKVGKSVRGPCPLHGGDDPNFSIDPGRQIFKCFVCGEGGDVFAFVMKHLGMDFPEAVRHVGKRVGVEVPEREEERGPDPHAPVREAAAFAAEWFAERLLEDAAGESAREHLRGRGIELAAAERYGLGYAPDAWRALRDAASRRGIGDEELLEAGLLATSERADEPYDRFRGRLIFTIMDLRDRAIAFGGRRLDGAGDRQVPKYINSPESPIFRKGRTLYGLNWARHAVRKEDAALVVEGYMDVLALHVRGMDRAVAPLGTSLTEDQAAALSRYAERAFLIFDSDAAGLKATFRTADRLLAAGVHPMVVTLPADHDPDSLAREAGIEALRSCLADAVDVLERKLQILEQRGYMESIEGRRRAVDGLLKTLRAVKDPSLRDIYLDRAAERTGVRRSTLVEEVARAERRGVRRERAPDRSRRRPGATTRPGSDAPAMESVERHVLLLLLRDQAARDGAEEMPRNELLRRAVEAGLEPEHFENERHAAIFRRLTELGRLPAPERWSELFEPAERRLLEELRADPTELTHPETIFRESVLRLTHRPRIERLREIEHELEMADDEQAMELLQEKMEIASDLREKGVRFGLLDRWSRRP